MDHEVTAKLAPQVLSKKDLVITIKTDGKKLGKLLISRGNIEWLPSGNSVNKRTMSWTEFRDFMQAHGTETKITKTKS